MSLFSRFYNKLYVDLNPWIRDHWILPYKRRRLKNKDVSILSSNCVGACIAHDLGLRFNSPFVNLWLYPKDFIKYCHYIDHYLECELQFLSEKETKLDYPVARLDDITIYFMHYHSEQEAREKWIERSARINKDNLCCILTERDGCTEDDLKIFASLPYPTASLVHFKMLHIPNTHYIRGFEKEKEVGNVMFYRSVFGFKYFDDFNYIRFFNSVGKYLHSPNLTFSLVLSIVIYDIGYHTLI